MAGHTGKDTFGSDLAIMLQHFLKRAYGYYVEAENLSAEQDDWRTMCSNLTQLIADTTYVPTKTIKRNVKAAYDKEHGRG